MAIHLTRCPHCRTTFRVRDEHLTIAKGAVRCGSCLQVFAAADHFVEAEPLTPTTTSTAAAQTTSKAAAPVHTISQENSQDDDDDFGLIHDDMDLDDEPEQIVKSTKTTVDDELIADDMFNDFGIRSDSNKRKEPSGIDIDTSVFALRDAKHGGLHFLDGDTHEEPGLEDEAWTTALLKEEAEAEAEAERLRQEAAARPVIDESEFNYDRPAPEIDDFAGFDFDDDIHDAMTDDNDLDHPAAAIPSGKNRKPTARDMTGSDELMEVVIPAPSLESLQDDPLEFAPPTATRWPWGWLLGCLLMILLAAGQALYFQFNDWSRHPQWRPLYSQLCQLFDCRLPALQNVHVIEAQHLVVRPHPRIQNALMLDTLLFNRAEHSQPFPDLALVFRDLNQKVVASRTFKPHEYLSGEMAGQLDMPSRTGIHIALELVDPGPEGVSYAIHFVANQ
ncbi:MAG: DUF3426 domain-containing protein [Bacterioplanes sp.]|nr:DUF3426 domain-containing protein [Bacterioplanes sp.]